VSCPPLLGVCLPLWLTLSLLLAWLVVATSGFPISEREKRKEEKKGLQERLCRQEQTKYKALPMSAYYFQFLKSKGHGQAFGMTSSSHRWHTIMLITFVRKG